MAFVDGKDDLQSLVDEGLRSLEAGHALPSIWYTDPRLCQAEIEKIFRHSWQYACHLNDLLAQGDYFTGVVANLPYVITRTAGGDLAAFLNVCRHRLHRVVEGCGNARALQCPYHGWTYDLGGRLIGVPRGMELKGVGGAPFSKENAGLIAFSVDTWGQLVFVNPDPQASPLSATLGAVAEIAPSRGIHLNLPRAGRDEMIIECNWKVFVDNILECYHCPTVHPILAGTHDVQHVKYEYYSSAGLQTIEARPEIRGTQGPDTRDHHACYVWPALWVSGRAGESFFLLITDPIDVRHTRVIKEYYLPENMSELAVAERIATFRRVIGEDIGVCLSTQRGHDTGMVPPGYLAQDIEVTVRHFQGLVMDMLRTERNTMPLASLGRVVKN